MALADSLDRAGGPAVPAGGGGGAAFGPAIGACGLLEGADGTPWGARCRDGTLSWCVGSFRVNPESARAAAVGCAPVRCGAAGAERYGAECMAAIHRKSPSIFPSRPPACGAIRESWSRPGCRALCCETCLSLKAMPMRLDASGRSPPTCLVCIALAVAARLSIDELPSC